jgi:transposase, IS5 family
VDRFPDEWEALIKADALDALFEEMDRSINQAGFIPRSGQIVDASLVAAPRQRNTDGEKAAIKASKSASEIWPHKPAKAARKDVDGRWTVKYSKAKARPDGTKPIRHCRSDQWRDNGSSSRSQSMATSPTSASTGCTE